MCQFSDSDSQWSLLSGRWWSAGDNNRHTHAHKWARLASCHFVLAVNVIISPPPKTMTTEQQWCSAVNEIFLLCTLVKKMATIIFPLYKQFFFPSFQTRGDLWWAIAQNTAAAQNRQMAALFNCTLSSSLRSTSSSFLPLLLLLLLTSLTAIELAPTTDNRGYVFASSLPFLLPLSLSS